MAYIVQNTIKTKAKTFEAGTELSADDVKSFGSKEIERFIADGAVKEVGKKSEDETPPELDLEALRLEADELGIEYQANIGAKKLAAKIAEFKEGK